MSTAEQVNRILETRQATPSVNPFGNVDATQFDAAAQGQGAGRFLNGPLDMSALFGAPPGNATPAMQPNVPAIHSLPMGQMTNPMGGLLGNQIPGKQRQMPYIPPTPGNFRGLIA